jgi:cell division septation protein DedD
MDKVNIRYKKRGRYYRTPVMLDRGAMQKIGLGMVLSVVVVFLSGYIVGFKKAEIRFSPDASSVVTLALALPGAEPVAISGSGERLPQPPYLELDESFDADISDEQRLASQEPRLQKEEWPVESEVHLEAKQLEAKQRSKEIPSHKARPEVHSKAEADAQLAAQYEAQAENMEYAQVTSSVATGGAIGGPAEPDPEQDATRHIAIYDDSSEDMAEYSVQVGMFRKLKNAENKVEELVALDLNAYLLQYTNKQRKLRYKVCFGFFAKRKSAVNALAIYEKELAGSGYVIPLQQPIDTI